MLSKILCFFGGHAYRFVMHSGCAYTVDPRNNGRAAATMWKCKYCDAVKWRWHKWAVASSKANGGFY